MHLVDGPGAPRSADRDRVQPGRRGRRVAGGIPAGRDAV